MSRNEKMKPLPDATQLDELDDVDLKDRTRLKAPRTLETTLFDRLEKLYGPAIKRVLQVQYR